ncbi:hypothetical protein BXU11_13935 [Flavobacterium sp. LM5]|uniref:hypothetical protein n=1 Tax=Flavobacterium sp. LM5 TaxID=1938610 RepID=UPI000992D516|nr:hypothetical protein [Flavobacterium sp. LM5]OOV25769.1 hypothetical protein BXU11_13935 [Flavobacterium sp. LM5]
MQKTESRIKIIGIYQIIGGLIGLIATIPLLVKFGFTNGTTFKMFLLFLSLYSFSVFCGYLLLKKQFEKGLNYSIINQLIQVLSFSILGFTFKFYSGLFLSLGLNLTTDAILTYNFGLTTWNFKLISENGIIEISINLVALILINIVFNLKEKLKAQKTQSINNN